MHILHHTLLILLVFSFLKSKATSREQVSQKGKEINTRILIHASPEKVWKILSEFNKYPEWNPFIVSIHGEAREGKRLKVRIVPPGKKPMTFKPQILSYEENKKIRWLGHFLVPGIFDGEHIFEIIDNQDGTITFVQRERFRGLLLPFLKKMLNENTRQGFELMNAKLKELAETN